MVKEMLKEKAGYLLSNLLSQGGEYGEIFYEKVRTCRIQLEDNKIDKVQWGIDEGVGIRQLRCWSSLLLAHGHSSAFCRFRRILCLSLIAVSLSYI